MSAFRAHPGRPVLAAGACSSQWDKLTPADELLCVPAHSMKSPLVFRRDRQHQARNSQGLPPASLRDLQHAEDGADNGTGNCTAGTTEENTDDRSQVRFRVQDHWSEEACCEGGAT